MPEITEDKDAKVRRWSVDDGVVHCHVADPGVPVDVAHGVIGPAVSHAGLGRPVLSVLAEVLPAATVALLEVADRREISAPFSNVGT